MNRAVRSTLFGAAFYALTAIVGVCMLPLLAAPRRWSRPPLAFWANGTLWLLRRLCRIDVRVIGTEHLPREGPALVAAKHQSAFDTLIWLALLPDAVYVVKRELFAIPIYGWHARKYGMIAVDRAAGASALRHLVRASIAALAEGRQVVIFPEGTRVAPGGTARYQPGFAAMAARTGMPVLPVATDSGSFWGRGLFGKSPGTITVSVLPALPAGLLPRELVARLQAVIEAEQVRLGPPAACG